MDDYPSIVFGVLQWYAIIILTNGQEFMRRVLSLTSCVARRSHDAIIFMCKLSMIELVKALTL